jgi:hypothetical protein
MVLLHNQQRQVQNPFVYLQVYFLQKEKLFYFMMKQKIFLKAVRVFLLQKGNKTKRG